MTEMRLMKAIANQQMYFCLTIMAFFLMNALSVTSLLTNSWGQFEDGSYFGLFEMCTSQDECSKEGITVREIAIRSIIITSLVCSFIGFLLTVCGKFRNNLCYMVFGVVFFYVGACSLLVAVTMFAIRPYGDIRWGYSTFIAWMSVAVGFYTGIVAQISMSHLERKFMENHISEEQNL